VASAWAAQDLRGSAQWAVNLSIPMLATPP
jgi:hypothetical protein